MALTCEKPTKVTLKYTSIIPNKIHYSGKKYESRSTPLGQKPPLGIYEQGANDFFTISSENIDTEITWEFQPNPIQSWYRYPLIITPAGTQNDPSPVVYDVFFPGRIKDIGFWFNENGTTYWKIGELTPSETRSIVQPGWQKVATPINGNTVGQLLDISIGSGEIHNQLGFAWDMKIYFDGQYKLTKIVRSNTETPPNNNVFIIEGEPNAEITKSFTFVDIPEKVELTQLENSEYSWQLIKISPGDIQEKILSFAGIEPELLCFIGAGQCPENTCPVSCGDTICCYNSNGISVSSLLKAESNY